MIHKLIENIGSAAPWVVTLRCPHCRHVGSFHGFPNSQDLTWQEKDPARTRPVAYAAGERRCPNYECQGLVQVILQSGARQGRHGEAGDLLKRLNSTRVGESAPRGLFLL